MMKTPELANVKRRLHRKFGRYQNEEEEPQQAEEEGEVSVVLTSQKSVSVPAFPSQRYQICHRIVNNEILSSLAEEPEEANEDDAPEEEQEEHELTDIGEQNVGLVDVASNAVSRCPVENGVIQSPWGAFSAGTVIAGIAAGLERQSVNVRDLIGENHMGQMRMARQQALPTVDNRFAATLSGDIAEAVLRQVPATPIQVGAPGAWNNSAVPRWFFLSQRERLEMTDAEIRGGIDGLVMGSNIAQWRSNAQNLRLSQVLDMYYSQRGIFGRTTDERAVRACNRRALFPVVAPIERLREQSVAFTTVLDGEMQTQVTLTANSTRRFAEQASEALNTHIGKDNRKS
jgi:hypothetical protein